MPNITSGAGSKTPFYKLFNVKELCRAKATREYDFTPCSEINENKSKYVQCIPRADTSTALAVQSSSPRDKAYHWFRDRARLKEFAAIHIV